MNHVLKCMLLVAAVAACVTLSPAQDTGPSRQPSGQQAQKQAERERKEEERRRKAEEKEAQRQPGVRCERYGRKSSR